MTWGVGSIAAIVGLPVTAIVTRHDTLKVCFNVSPTHFFSLSRCQSPGMLTYISSSSSQIAAALTFFNMDEIRVKRGYSSLVHVAHSSSLSARSKSCT